MMESATLSKGVALFATLIGIYNWIGQGTSLFDIVVLVFAAALIMNVDFGNERKSDLPLEQGETQNNKQSFFSATVAPLSHHIMAWREHFFEKKVNLTPFYLFSFN